jgi:predicted dehydrogenase
MNALARRIRVAIVGSGEIARVAHLPAVESLADDLELVAAVDVDLGRAEALAAHYRIAGAYVDLALMLAEVEPDLVIVCTPPAAHHPAIRQCLEAGAWVWCEKPPVLSLAEYDDLAAYERDGGPYVSYVFQHRFGSAGRHLRAQIEAGTLGRMLVGVCHTLWFRDAAYYEVPWRGRWETEGGGPSMGHGIHQMDLLLHLLGDWAEVRAMTATLARDVHTEDVSMAVVRFEDGALVSVVNSVLSPRETSYLRFDFTEATVELRHLYGYDNASWQWTPAPHLPAPASGWLPTDDVPSSHAAQPAELVAAMRTRQRPPASGADGRRVLELVAGLYGSAASGRPVLREELVAGHSHYDSMAGPCFERAEREVTHG